MKRFIAAITAVIMLLALACTPALAIGVRDAALDEALNAPGGSIEFTTEFFPKFPGGGGKRVAIGGKRR